MAADWTSFEKNLRDVKFDNSTIDDVAKFHANEYIKAVKNSEIILTASKSTIGLIEKNIEIAFKGVFNSLAVIKIQITPDYKNNINPNKESARKILEDIFEPLAITICTEWTREVFTPTLVPIGYLTPSTGYTITFPGDPSALTKDLAKAFFISQEEIDSEIALSKFISNLILAYTKHLLTISGVFNGTIPAAPSPIPGPPFPFIGVV